MNCCKKENMPEDRNPRNIRGRQIAQSYAKKTQHDKDQHPKQEKYQNPTKPRVHNFKRGSVSNQLSSSKGRPTESYTIRDLSQSGNLRAGTPNQSHSSRFPTLNKNDVAYPVYASSKLSRWDQGIDCNTRDQHVTTNQKMKDTGVSKRPTNSEDCKNFEDNTHIKCTEVKEKNLYYHTDSRFRDKARVHTFGASATLKKDRISGFSNNLQQDEIMLRVEVSPRQTIQENDRTIYSAGESTVQGRKPPTGLPNIGNTCYANSLLQVLEQTPFLYESLISCREHDSPSVYHQRKTTVTTAFCNLLQSMNSMTSGSKSGTIAALMNIVSSREHEFRIGFQNDCHSFLLTLLSELHDENQAKVATRLFEIEMVDEFAFDSCKHKEVTDTQIMRSLTVPSGSYNIEEGLKTLLYEEEFDEADVPCRECGTHGKGKTKKAMRFRTLPKVLVLQLGCFKEMSYGGHIHIAKSLRRIGFAEKMSVPRSNGSSVIYHLYGVVNHHGSVYGGHYTSFVKHSSHYSSAGHWYHCNDSHVRNSTLQEALESHDAYLLFYTM